MFEEMEEAAKAEASRDAASVEVIGEDNPDDYYDDYSDESGVIEYDEDGEFAPTVKIGMRKARELYVYRNDEGVFVYTGGFY